MAVYIYKTKGNKSQQENDQNLKSVAANLSGL